MIKDIVNDKLYRIVKHAYTDVSLYQKKKRDFLNKLQSKDMLEQMRFIPILEKDEAVLDNDGLLANDCIPLMLQDKLILENTSGSTGKYMEVYWKKADYQRSLLPLYIRRKEQYGISSCDKVCYFFSSRNIGKDEIATERKPGQIGFCKSGLNEERLRQMYEELLEFEPVWMLGQPSVMLLLAQVKEKDGLPDIQSLRYIELTGEMLFAGIRAEIQKAFPCPIADHYGSMEVNTIAYECPEGKMHLTESTYTEIIDEYGDPIPEGEEGDVCITSLENYAMPIVRYRVGDRAKLFRNVDCRCGLCGDVLELTTGRINDYIATETGEKINSYVFVRAVNVVNRCFSQAIKQFSIIQKSYHQFHVKLVLSDMGEKDMVQKMFLDNICQKELEDATYEFSYHSHLFPSEKNNKLRYFAKEDFDS